jgi:hypothetical protein
MFIIRQLVFFPGIITASTPLIEPNFSPVTDIPSLPLLGIIFLASSFPTVALSKILR